MSRAHFPLPWKARLQAEESVRKFPFILDPTEGPRKMYIWTSLRGRSLLNSEPDSFPGKRERKRHGVPAAAGCLVSDPSGIHCFFPGLGCIGRNPSLAFLVAFRFPHPWIWCCGPWANEAQLVRASVRVHSHGCAPAECSPWPPPLFPLSGHRSWAAGA